MTVLQNTWACAPNQIVIPLSLTLLQETRRPHTPPSWNETRLMDHQEAPVRALRMQVLRFLAAPAAAWSWKSQWRWARTRTAVSLWLRVWLAAAPVLRGRTWSINQGRMAMWMRKSLRCVGTATPRAFRDACKDLRSSIWTTAVQPARRSCQRPGIYTVTQALMGEMNHNVAASNPLPYYRRLAQATTRGSHLSPAQTRSHPKLMRIWKSRARAQRLLSPVVRQFAEHVKTATESLRGGETVRFNHNCITTTHDKASNKMNSCSTKWSWEAVTRILYYAKNIFSGWHENSDPGHPVHTVSMGQHYSCPNGLLLPLVWPSHF